MFCTKCGTSVEQGNNQCPQCGERVGGHAEGGVTLTIPPVKLPDRNQFGRFLNFDAMITPSIMKVLYVIISIGIIIGSLFIMFSGGFLSFLGGLVGCILMLVLFRVMCEQMLLFFIINRNLGEIRDNIRK